MCEFCPGNGEMCHDCLQGYLARCRAAEAGPDPAWAFWVAVLLAAALLGLSMAFILFSLPK